MNEDNLYTRDCIQGCIQERNAHTCAMVVVLNATCLEVIHDMWSHSLQQVEI